MRPTRRQLLLGAAGAVALPHLPSVAGETSPPLRVIFVQWDNGAPMDWFTPEKVGKNWEVSRILAPLAPHRHLTTVLTGLANAPAIEWSGGNHQECFASFLTGKALRPTVRLGNDVSIDQALVPLVGEGRVLPSVQLTSEAQATLGSCASDLFPCAYDTAISWLGPGRPLPPVSDPRVLYDRFFPGELPDAERARRRSALDVLRDQSSPLMSRASAEDRLRLEGWLDGLDQLERRLDAPVCGRRERPEVGPEDEEERLELAFDVLVSALACDATRVVSLTLGRARCDRVRAFAPIDHHTASHYQQGDPPEHREAWADYTTWCVGRVASLVDRLAQTGDGDGSLLDRTLVVAGSGMGLGVRHQPFDLPLFLVGTLGGRIRAGEHRVELDRPLSDLWLGLLHLMGDRRATFGDDGTEPLDLS